MKDDGNKQSHSFNIFFLKLLPKEHFDKIDNELFSTLKKKKFEREVEKLVNQFCCSFKLAPINQVQKLMIRRGKQNESFEKHCLDNKSQARRSAGKFPFNPKQLRSIER
jgi:hypothetical protein